eukprot:scaffold3529_cov271-Amphora_coffeaeformis.AAC.4
MVVETADSLNKKSSSINDEQGQASNPSSFTRQDYYGPFHRLRSPTQTDAIAHQQETSRELWGKPRQYSAIPQVQAYTGPLPFLSANTATTTVATAGLEFVTTTAPDTGTAPGHARWTGPRPGVWIEDGYAKIKIRVTQNTQQQTESTATTAAGTVLSNQPQQHQPQKQGDDDDEEEEENVEVLAA